MITSTPDLSFTMVYKYKTRGKDTSKNKRPFSPLNDSESTHNSSQKSLQLFTQKLFIKICLKHHELMPVMPNPVTSKWLVTSLSSGLTNHHRVLTIKCNYLFWKFHKLSFRYNYPFQIFKNVTHPPGVFRDDCKCLSGNLSWFCKGSRMNFIRSSQNGQLPMI